MFKKSLTVLAVLGAFAGTAMAADVTVYGVVDAGLAYTHDKTTVNAKINAQELKDSVKNDEFRMDVNFSQTGTLGAR